MPEPGFRKTGPGEPGSAGRAGRIAVTGQAEKRKSHFLIPVQVVEKSKGIGSGRNRFQYQFRPGRKNKSAEGIFIIVGKTLFPVEKSEQDLALSLSESVEPYAYGGRGRLGMENATENKMDKQDETGHGK